MQRTAHIAHRRFDGMRADINAFEVLQRFNQTDGAVAAHTQITAVVKENYTGARGGGFRLAQQRPYQNLRTTRLQNQRTTQMVETFGKICALLLRAVAGKLGKSVIHYTGRLTAGMGVNHGKSIFGMRHSKILSLKNFR